MPVFWGWLPGEKLQLHELHPAPPGQPAPGFGVSVWKQ